MNVRALLVGATGRPHAPWRILIFLSLATLGFIVAAIALRPLLGPVNRLTGTSFAAESLVLTAALLAAHAAMLGWVDRSGWSSVGLDGSAANARVLLRGWLVGALPIGAASLILLAVGWLAVVPSESGPWLTAAVQVSVALLPAAFYEELLTRGYIFSTLREWLGWPTALLVTSIAFGLLHLANPGAGAQSVALVIIAGIFLGAVLLATRSLYAAWMAHWAWNWVMAVPLHVPVSGIEMPQPDYQIVDAGPDLITGGTWGPEGGLAAGAGMLAGLGYLYWRSRGFRAPLLNETKQ